jgi:hypothetical protein
MPGHRTRGLPAVRNGSSAWTATPSAFSASERKVSASRSKSSASRTETARGSPASAAARLAAPAAKNAAHSCSAGSTRGSSSQTLCGLLRRVVAPGSALAATTAAAARSAARWAATYLAPADPSLSAAASPHRADSSSASADGATRQRGLSWPAGPTAFIKAPPIGKAGPDGTLPLVRPAPAAPGGQGCRPALPAYSNINSSRCPTVCI